MKEKTSNKGCGGIARVGMINATCGKNYGGRLRLCLKCKEKTLSVFDEEWMEEDIANLKEKTNSPESSLETPNKKQNQDKEKTLSKEDKAFNKGRMQGLDDFQCWKKQFIKEVLEEIDNWYERRLSKADILYSTTLDKLKDRIKQKAGGKLI